MKTNALQKFGAVPSISHHDAHTGFIKAQEEYMRLFKQRHELFDKPSDVDVEPEYMALTRQMESLENEMEMLKSVYEPYQWHEIAYRKSIVDQGGN